MRFVYGPIPRSRVLNPQDAGWTPLREPSSAVFVVQALFLSVPFLVLAFATLRALKGFLRTQPVALLALLSFFVLMIPIHETIHALANPGGLGSKHLIVGAWLRRGLCYVLYDSPVSRNRILVVLSAPFIIMSSVLGVVAVLVPSEWGLVTILAILVHTAVCTGDLVSFARLIRQVPKNSRVHNDGWKTYWESLP